MALIRPVNGIETAVAAELIALDRYETLTVQVPRQDGTSLIEENAFRTTAAE